MEASLLRIVRIFLLGIFLFLLGTGIVFFSLDIGNPESSASKTDTKKNPAQEKKTEETEQDNLRKKAFPSSARGLAVVKDADLGAMFLSMRNMEALEERIEGNGFQKIKIRGSFDLNGNDFRGSILFEFFGDIKEGAYFLTKITLNSTGESLRNFFPIQKQLPETKTETRALIEEVKTYINTRGKGEEKKLRLFCESGHRIRFFTTYCRVAETNEGAIGIFVFIPEKQLLFLHIPGQKI
jgi:hypothetical protein